MAISIRLSDDERQLAESYAKLYSLSLVEDEYDITLAKEAHEEYVKNGSQTRPIDELWQELDL